MSNTASSATDNIRTPEIIHNYQESLPRGVEQTGAYGSANITGYAGLNNHTQDSDYDEAPQITHHYLGFKRSDEIAEADTVTDSSPVDLDPSNNIGISNTEGTPEVTQQYIGLQRDGGSNVETSAGSATYMGLNNNNQISNSNHETSAIN